MRLIKASSRRRVMQGKQLGVKSSIRGANRKVSRSRVIEKTQRRERAKKPEYVVSSDDDDDEDDDGIGELECDSRMSFPKKRQENFDAEEMEYLERKLGLRGSDKERNLKKLSKQLRDLDGLGDDILELADKIVASKTSTGRKSGEACLTQHGGHDIPRSTSDSDGSAHGFSDASETSSVDELTVAPLSDTSSTDDDNDDNDDDDGDDGATVQELRRSDHYHRSSKTDPIKEGSLSKTGLFDFDTEKVVNFNLHQPSSCAKAEPSVSEKYVPPAKRVSLAANKAKEGDQSVVETIVSQADARIVGLVNRISEGNLLVISQQIMNEVFMRSTASLSDQRDIASLVVKRLSARVAMQMTLAAVENTYSTASLVGSQVAVLVVLTLNVGYQIGEQFIVSLIVMFEKHWKALRALASSASEKGSDDYFNVISDECKFLRLAVVAFSLLYDFGLLSSMSIFSLIRRLFDGVDEKSSAHKLDCFEARMDLLLTCFRHVGAKFRSQSAEDWREMLAFVFQRVPKSASCSEVSQRTVYFLQELEAMKHNKVNVCASERFAFIRGWLLSYLKSKAVRHSSPEFPADLVFTVSNWVAVAENRELPHCVASGRSTNQQITALLGSQAKCAASQQYNSLLEKARALRLHTDIQRTTFVALVGAVDVRDAVQRVVAVAHQRHMIPHAVAVILHTGLQEKLFNGFYPQVLLDLACLPSALGKKYKRAAKQGIVAQLFEVHKFSLRQMLHFTKFLAWVVCTTMWSPNRILDLKVLRFIQFAEHKTGEKARLLHMFVFQICKEFCSWVADHSQGAEPCATDITNGEQQPQFTRTSSLFEQQVSSLTSCEDVAQMMVLAAQQLLSGNASDTTKRRAKALICILSERFS